MRWKNIKNIKGTQFQRAVGVKRATFAEMVKVIREHIQTTRKIPRRCRPSKLSVEDQLLMTLMYLREYRTYFHIAMDYGLSESTVCRTIHKIEDILIKSKSFRLPGKKELLQSNDNFEVILVDATESAIERPKKSRGDTTQEKRRSIP